MTTRSHRRRRGEQGYVAIMVSILLPVVFLGCAATAVDTARWYLEVQKVQKAADAAALAGVPYLPQALDKATARAKTVAARNGYDDASPDVEVDVGLGDRPSQLRVTITSHVENQFGAMIGVPHAAISETAVADYTGPAPMGSPCNTFGNEPPPGSGAASPLPHGTARGTAPFPNCSSDPQLWANVEGPGTGKVQGDRYQTRGCESSHVDGCDSSRNNTEYDDSGYFWVVKVQPGAVGTPVTVQLYDPEFANTGQTCGSLAGSGWSDNMNPYVTDDGTARYGQGDHTSVTGASFCTGDSFPGYGSGGSPHLMTTSFALRGQTDTQNPLKGTPVSGCTKQYTGVTGTPDPGSLTSGTGSYNDSLAQVFHNWTNLCTFTPSTDGDYYLQVRTNVTTSGGLATTNTNGNPPLIYSGNPNVASLTTGNTYTGEGSNAFGIRAVTQSGLEHDVAVSGYSRMPIYANASGADSTFNLIRVLPGAAGQYISFSFFDAGDASGSGTVKIIPPADATGSIQATPFPGGCTAQGGNALSSPSFTTLTGCSAPISNTANNGKTETVTIPVPGDYTCDQTAQQDCWYQVEVSFGGGTSVHDVTTWDASVVGDPVRLVE